MGGITGLRAEAINIAMDIIGVLPDDRQEVFMKVKFLGKVIAGELCQV